MNKLVADGVNHNPNCLAERWETNLEPRNNVYYVKIKSTDVFEDFSVQQAQKNQFQRMFSFLQLVVVLLICDWRFVSVHKKVHYELP